MSELRNKYSNSGHGFVEISLTNSDKTFVIDEEDIDLVQQCKSWNANFNPDKSIKAIQGRVDGKTVFLHRFLMKDALENTNIENAMIDHIDRNTTNNRRSNLRVVSKTTNNRSRRVMGKSSKFPGVSWYKNYKKWHARIRLDGMQKHLGYYVHEQDAARAYRKAFRLVDTIADYEIWKELSQSSQPTFQTNITTFFHVGDVNNN